MSFFEDLKEDLSQAVNEMISNEGGIGGNTGGTLPETDDLAEIEAMFRKTIEEEEAKVEKEEVKNEVVTSSLEEDLVDELDTSFIEKTIEELLPPPEESPIAGLDSLSIEKTVEELLPPLEEATVEELLPPLEEDTVEELIKESVKETIRESGERKLEMNRSFSQAHKDEVSTITAGMVINGDITAEGSLDLVGCVHGNISVSGKMSITGTIEGNSQASEIYAESAKITGEIRSEGSVKVGQDTVIIGNIFATSVVVAGAVKGDIDVQGPVVLDTTAIVMGNIKSKSVQINNGAVIEGMCSQCYADVNPISFFDEIKQAVKL